MKIERSISAALVCLLVVQLAFLGILMLRIDAISRSVQNMSATLLSTTNVRPLVEDIVPNVSAADNPSQGSPEAPIQIIEFADFTCSACRDVQPVLKELLQKYKGEITLVYRYFPLGAEGTDAFITAVAAECATQQGTFWEMHDVLFAHRGVLSKDDLLSYAIALSLDEMAFAECLASYEAAAKVQNDIAAGREYGVRATPTFFVNGRKVIGSIPMSVFEGLIEEIADID